MATKYLLPCSCGKSIPIDSKQAGQSLQCDCGQTVEAPSMREIRQLPPDLSVAAEQRPAEWTAAAGTVFVLGMLLAVAGLIVAGLSFYFRLGVLLPPPNEELIQAWVDEVDRGSPEEIWAIWQATVHQGLGDQEVSPFILSQRMADAYWRSGWRGLTCLLIGVLISLCALGLRRKARQPARRTSSSQA